LIAAGALFGGSLAFGTVSIDDQAIGDSQVASAAVSIAYKSNRDVIDQTAAVLETWVDSGLGSNYEIRATLQSGINPTSGTMGAWLPLSSDRTWTLARSTVGINNSQFLIEIRLSGQTTALDSATISLAVEVTGGGGGGGFGDPPWGHGGGEEE
jgi:hypothetical protein